MHSTRGSAARETVTPSSTVALAKVLPRARVLPLAFAFFAAVTVTVPAVARAQSKPAASAAPLPRAQSKPAASAAPLPLAQALTGNAKAEYDAGKAFLGEGVFSSALLKFGAAYELSKDPRILWNMAVCEKNLHHYAKVTKLLRRYKEEGAAVLTANDVQEAEDLLWALQSLTASLRIGVNQPDADVFIDDELVGKTPLEKPMDIDIGTHKLRVTKEGFQEQVQDVTVGGAPETKLQIKLEKLLHEGRVSVTAHAGDAILVDGKPVGMAKWEGSVTSGSHLVRVTAKDMKPYETEITLQDREVHTLTVTLDPDPSLKKGPPAWIFIAGGSALLVGASIGGYFLFRPDPEKAVVTPGNLGSVEAAHPFRF